VSISLNSKTACFFRLVKWGIIAILILLLAASLGACSGDNWNNPYPKSQSNKNILYSSFSERPKHLDPARSYSATEYRFIGNIYEPPLQYHYLTRELMPLTATQLPDVQHYDKENKLIKKPSAVRKVAYSLYNINIKKGIQYQPHPAFARDPAGNLLYHQLSPATIAAKNSLADFKKTATRELTSDDYAYQIKRLAHPRINSPILSTMAKYIVGLKELSQQLAQHNRKLKLKIQTLERLLNEIDRVGTRGESIVDIKNSYTKKFKKNIEFYWAHRVAMDFERVAKTKRQASQLKLMISELVAVEAIAKTGEEAIPTFQQNLKSAQLDYQYLDLKKFELPGVKVIDRYTYQIKIKGQYPQLKYWLAMPFFAPVPHEAEKFYSQKGMKEQNISMNWYPVGTGAYFLSKNDPNSQMIMQRNPNFRGMPYPDRGEKGDEERGLLRDKNKMMPFVDKVVYSLEKESIPLWSKFLQGYFDASGLISESFDQAVKINVSGDARLTDTMATKGIKLITSVRMSISYLGFNMLDPVVGGYEPKKQYLRQAISIAVDYEEYISIFLNGRGKAAQGPLPPGMFGHAKGKAGINPFVYDWVDGKPKRKSIEIARQLMVKAGFSDGIDPKTGEKLILYFDVTGGGAEDKANRDWYKEKLDQIGIQLEIRETDYNRFQQKMLNGKAQLFRLGWNADYPDPENFLFLLYGPNGKVKHRGENAANYDNVKFNALFKIMETMPDSVVREKIIRRMVAISTKDSPWIWGFNPKSFALYHQWYKNAKTNDLAHNLLMYKRIDAATRHRLRARWNKPIMMPVYILLLVIFVTLIPAIRVYKKSLKKTMREVNLDNTKE